MKIRLAIVVILASSLALAAQQAVPFRNNIPVAPTGLGSKPLPAQPVVYDTAEGQRIRVVVAAIVMVAVVAVIAQGVVDGFTAAGAILLPPIGFAFSHAQRHRSNWATKVILAVALMAAFGAFLQSVRLAGSVDELDRVTPEERRMLDDLAKLFVENGYDVRWLISGIAKSRTGWAASFSACSS